MATLILDNAYVSVAGTEWSADVKEITLSLAVDEFDVSAFGVAAHQYSLGAGNHSVTMGMFWGADAARIMEVAALVEAKAAVALIVRPKNAVKSGTNPEITCNILPKSIPLGGAWNTPHEANLSWNISGTVQIDDGTSTPSF